MKRHTTFLPRSISSWSLDELCKLRQLADSGTSVDIIAMTLKRSASAIRNKAGLHGISLRTSSPQAPRFVNQTEAVGSEHCSLAVDTPLNAAEPPGDFLRDYGSLAQ